jgi:hypothetical protein
LTVLAAQALASTAAADIARCRAIGENRSAKDQVILGAPSFPEDNIDRFDF